MRGGWREYQSADRVSGGGIAQNSLDTGTLGFSDLQNEADYKVSHTGISLSSSKPSGGDFSMGGMISAASHSGHAEGTTQAAVANGTITVRDTANQKQDVANLSRDTENANDSISPIFDKEKEQNRLKTVGLISDIGSQAADIAKTQGDIYALEAAKKEVPALKENATDKEREQYVKDLRSSPAYQKEMANFGTGSTLQRGIQSVTAALQGLAGGNIAGALAGASAPELANIIGHHMGIDDDPATKAVAHAILGGAVAALQGNNAMAGAAGAAVGEVIASQLYPNVPKDKLTEDQKQTISTLASISAGIAGGLAGDSTLSAAAGSQAGKNAVENNYLSVSEKTELEIAKQTLKNSKDPAEREKAQQKYDALVEKDITSDKAVIAACSNGQSASAACAGERLKVIAAKGGYETGNYNNKVSQMYPDAYSQIVNLLNITSVDAQNQQQVKEAMINYFMVDKGVDRQTAEGYTETKQGMDIIIASVAPILGGAIASKLSNIGSEAVIKSSLLKEMTAQGIKYSPENIVQVSKNSSGKIVFLETGNDRAGLNHIIKEHGSQFASIGVSETEIPNVVMKAVSDNNIVGYQGSGTGRPIYETTINGKKYNIAVTVGNNGFIVGANLRGAVK